MEESITESNKNVAAIMHGSTFLKYFFPLGNFFAPLLLWTLHKDKPFLNYHGKQALNFQLSILVYALGIGILSLPFVAIFASDFVGLAETLEGASHYDHSGILPHLGGYLTLLFVFAMLFIGLFLFELYYVITATIKASKGAYFKYPLCIQFISENGTIEDTTTNETEPLTEENH
ncbi:DUF4870 domain-containing protein [Patiriisocius sp. Uisw_017]|jgi:uncharacterized Tic20 family protein|uniref:DUF4870 domain-containing protein n=1 Tax=Patiriisocius sp. Uisw_017 TaxID=3230968 RepID=UPI0039EAD9E3